MGVMKSIVNSVVKSIKSINIIYIIIYVYSIKTIKININYRNHI